MMEHAASHALLSASYSSNSPPSEANTNGGGNMRASVANVARIVADTMQFGECDPCQSTPILINTWLHYTPEFRSIVVAVSSPLPITLLLWLVTKAVARARLIAADVERARAGDGM